MYEQLIDALKPKPGFNLNFYNLKYINDDDRNNSIKMLENKNEEA